MATRNELVAEWKKEREKEKTKEKTKWANSTTRDKSCIQAAAKSTYKLISTPRIPHDSPARLRICVIINTDRFRLYPVIGCV